MKTYMKPIAKKIEFVYENVTAASQMAGDRWVADFEQYNNVDKSECPCDLTLYKHFESNSNSGISTFAIKVENC